MNEIPCLADFRKAVELCRYEQFTFPSKLLRHEKVYELVAAKKLMAHLRIRTIISDEDSGDVSLFLSNGKAGKKFSPIFKKGALVAIWFIDVELNCIRGIVSEVLHDAIVVHHSQELPHGVTESLRVHLHEDMIETTYINMLNAISKAESVKRQDERDDFDFKLHKTLKLMIGVTKSEGLPEVEDSTESTIKPNEAQLTTVNYAINNNISVIHGPPGTGKSTTILAILEKLIQRGESVLVCGASNAAVDAILEGLFKAKLPCLSEEDAILRIGNMFKMTDNVKKCYGLDTKINKIPSIRRLQNKIRRCRSKQLRKLLKEMLNTERMKYTRMYVAKCRVMGATLQASARLSGEPKFTTIIIDEISQASFPECLIPASSYPNAFRLVVAGDNKQLPPTVIPKDKKVRNTLGTTLFDILLKYHGEQNRKFLKVQHRMNEEIMRYPSDKMYNSELVAHESVKNSKLSDEKWVQKDKLTDTALMWIDTSIVPQIVLRSGASCGNSVEVTLVESMVRRLTNLGISQNEIGVLTPYKFQVNLILNKLHTFYKNVEVSTIDGFQGREKPVIIFSMVTFTGEGTFLKDNRRLNVAVTRARKFLCVIGHMDFLSSLSKESFISGFVQHCKDNARVEVAKLEGTVLSSSIPVHPSHSVVG